MFLKLSIKNQIAILAIKIKEIDFSKDYNDPDKKEILSFYRKKLTRLKPNTKL
jgi:hypothetical protein